MGENFYEILGVSKDSSKDDIKKAYRKLAMKYHPDRSNDNNRKQNEEKFKDISRAYGVLSDDEKKGKYDKFGEDGLSGNNFDADEIFRQFFGGSGMGNMNSMSGMGNIFNMFGGGMKRQNYTRQTPDNYVEIHCPLSDIYTGKNVDVEIPKNIKCIKCDGIGCNNKDNIKKCDICNGTGEKENVTRNGPMISIQRSQCTKCNGQGKIINDSDKCKECKGFKYIKSSNKMTIKIKPGTNNGDHIVCKSEGNWDPNTGKYGNLIFIIKEGPSNNGMRREGRNLCLTKSISLRDALCGGKILIKHLDGSYIKINISDYGIIKPNQRFIVKGEGMLSHNGKDNGDLIIIFDIKFPNNLDEKRKEYLSKIFEGQIKNENNEDINNVSNGREVNIKKLDDIKF